MASIGFKRNMLIPKMLQGLFLVSLTKYEPEEQIGEDYLYSRYIWAKTSFLIIILSYDKKTNKHRIYFYLQRLLPELLADYAVISLIPVIAGFNISPIMSTIE